VKVFNGRGQHYWDGKQWEAVEHVYIGAKSKADAVRVMREHGFKQFMISELNTYFSPCWGNSMEGVTPARGVWVRRFKLYTERPVKL